MKRHCALVSLVVAFVLCTNLAKAATQNPFRPAFCGQCTDGAWIAWVLDWGQRTVPSLGNATSWWYNAPYSGFGRGAYPYVPSIMVFNGFQANRGLGHVAVVWGVSQPWPGGSFLLYVSELNWSPATAGNCNAPLQWHYFAYTPYQGAAYWWNGRQWVGTFPVLGFVYPKPNQPVRSN